MPSNPRNSLEFFPLSNGASELILASSSRYRASLLERLGIPFRSESPDADESPRAGEQPHELVQRLSVDKARKVAESHPTALVVGSDQLAVCDQQVLGKPGTESNARDQLAMLSGRTVEFLTGLCLVNAATGAQHVALAVTPVTFRSLSAAQIANYVEREQPLDCAGAFKSEGLGIALFTAIGGDDPNALVGLPLIELCNLLAEEGLSVLNQRFPG